MSTSSWNPATAETGTTSAHSPSSLTARSCSAIRSCGDLIGLGDDRDDRGALERGELPGQVLVAGTDVIRRGDAEADHVDLGERGADQAVEALAEQRPRPVQAGRVDDDQLRVGPVHDAADHPPRRLRAVARDRDLGADERVGERGLADVRTADQAREARPEDGLSRRGAGRCAGPPGSPGLLLGHSRLVHPSIVAHAGHLLGCPSEGADDSEDPQPPGNPGTGFQPGSARPRVVAADADPPRGREG